MMDFKDLRKAQTLLSRWVAGAVKSRKAERLADFVLNDTGNEASILRNRLGLTEC